MANLRPCRCDKSDCYLCNLYHTSPRHKEAWDQETSYDFDAFRPPETVGKIALTCAHQGELMERASCLCPRKNKYKCKKNLGNQGVAVPVETCNATCSQYEPEEE